MSPSMADTWSGVFESLKYSSLGSLFFEPFLISSYYFKISLTFKVPNLFWMSNEFILFPVFPSLSSFEMTCSLDLAPFLSSDKYF
jgi:hypothetical protein